MISELADHWQFISNSIDYVPIFNVARDLLLAMPADGDVDAALHALGEQALSVVREKAALRHDLMGRVYHRLLVHAKYLGTYYTSVPAATLLLKLALSPSDWTTHWEDLDAVSELKIGDLACGTGTLLMAAAETVSDNHIRRSADRGLPIDLKILHARLMENVLYGYDVLPSALHLTASTLALRASGVGFRETNLFNMPLGGTHRRLGSIEFLRDREAAITVDLFGATAGAGQVTGAGDTPGHIATLPDLDLCVMNPPFTRSVGNNLLFGSVPEPERNAMQRDLATLLQRNHVMANSTAGLGSVFVATGDRALKVGGRMALVLPKALLSGVAWGPTRELFQRRYQLECIVASHDPTRWNFSDNTSLSEVLVVARKTGEDHDPNRESVRCVNLWANPQTAFEALSVASSVIDAGIAPDIETEQGANEVTVGDRKVGEALSIPWAELQGSAWLLPCSFAQSELVRLAYHLLRGRVYTPGSGELPAIPLSRLGDLGTLGPDRRDIWDGFDRSEQATPYPAYWGHDATTCTSLAQEINTHLSPLPRARTGRPLRRVQDLWPRAGDVMIAEGIRLNTQRIVAFSLDQNALSNVWWPLKLQSEDAGKSKALVLWLNSTLGLVALIANREETEGPWMSFKKPVLTAMPVIDTNGLTARQIRILSRRFDDIAGDALLPFPQMATDPIRARIDEAVSEALNIGDLASAREMLGREPVLCLTPL